MIRRQQCSRRSGFTLMELVVVGGLIALLAGFGAIALLAHQPSQSMDLAQRTLVAALHAARTQAQARGSEVVLVVHTDAETTAPLRTFTILVRDPSAPSGWSSAGASLRLPAGTMFVPPIDTSLSVVSFEADWPAELRSVAESSLPSLPDGYCGVAWFSTQAAGASAAMLYLAPTRRDGAGWTLLAPSRVRGVAVSAYGVVTAVLEGEGDGS